MLMHMMPDYKVEMIQHFKNGSSFEIGFAV